MKFNIVLADAFLIKDLFDKPPFLQRSFVKAFGGLLISIFIALRIYNCLPLFLPIVYEQNNLNLFNQPESFQENVQASTSVNPKQVNLLKAADILKENKIDVYVVNIHTIKPIDKNLIINLAKKAKLVITAEDHNIIGGLGSAVAEVLSENFPCRMLRIGMEDRYGESGKPDELYEKYGLNANNVARKVKGFVKKK